MTVFLNTEIKGTGSDQTIIINLFIQNKKQLDGFDRLSFLKVKLDTGSLFLFNQIETNFGFIGLDKWCVKL